jgi:ABC-type polysaccharide/polyol phosphate transport system ATPase subunit
VSAPAISARGVSKRYIKYHDNPMLLSTLKMMRRGTRREQLWAVRDLDLTVHAGECVGVLGRNGSGKSTLLQMVAGITAPTLGEMVVRGRVAPLISVGVGFHPELTGRDNVFINGSILGLSRTEVAARFDEIVAFSGVEEFIDTPVKFYSSGMSVRLGFSVAVASRPDVLLVDEVLAVGDMAFQMKCYDRMAEIRASGTTILVVTHNALAVRALCERAVLLERGRMTFEGPTIQTIDALHRALDEEREPEAASPEEGRLAHVPGRLIVLDTQLLAADGSAVSLVSAGTELTLAIKVRAVTAIAAPFLGVTVTAATGVHVYTDTNVHQPYADLQPGEERWLRVRLMARLGEGGYDVTASIGGQLHGNGQVRLGTARRQNFFAAGRGMVHGVADLAGAFTSQATGDAAALGQHSAVPSAD